MAAASPDLAGSDARRMTHGASSRTVTRTRAYLIELSFQAGELPGSSWSRVIINFHGVGGTSIAGLRSKNPSGLSINPMVETGITGQSSGRGTWLWANTYHNVRSVLTISR